MNQSRKKFFIILSSQRSGSTYLRDWLDLHPSIRCHDEVFLHSNENAECLGTYLGKHCLSRPLAKPFRSKGKLGGGIFSSGSGDTCKTCFRPGLTHYPVKGANR